VSHVEFLLKSSIMKGIFPLVLDLREVEGGIDAEDGGIDGCQGGYLLPVEIA
jgi:hypothetical protein